MLNSQWILVVYVRGVMQLKTHYCGLVILFVNCTRHMGFLLYAKTNPKKQKYVNLSITCLTLIKTGGLVDVVGW